MHIWRTRQVCSIFKPCATCLAWINVFDVFLLEVELWHQDDLKVKLTGNVQLNCLSMRSYVLFIHVTKIRYNYLLTTWKSGFSQPPSKPAVIFFATGTTIVVAETGNIKNIKTEYVWLMASACRAIDWSVSNLLTGWNLIEVHIIVLALRWKISTLLHQQQGCFIFWNLLLHLVSYQLALPFKWTQSVTMWTFFSQNPEYFKTIVTLS